MSDCPADYRATKDEIAADQRRDVAAALAELGPDATAEQVSDRVWLAVEVARRRMRELNQGGAK